MSYDQSHDKQKDIEVYMKKIIDRIHRPTSITFATLPGDKVETMFIATQIGEIIAIRNGKSGVFLDIRKKVCHQNSSKHSDRGMLGLVFHPDFSSNGKFYLYYSQSEDKSENRSKNKSPKYIPVNSCDKKSLHQEWDDRNRYDHINRLEEWLFLNNNCEPVREILSIRQPFDNNNGSDNLVFHDGRLLIGLGDGGGSHDPYNLAQDDDSIFGKLLSIDVDTSFCAECTVTAFSEMTDSQRDSIKVLAKGIRNTGHPAFNNDIGLIYNNGQSGGEAIYSFYPSNNIMNLGWRPWEGAFPTINEERTGSSVDSANMVVLWDIDAFPCSGEGVSIKIYEGDTVGFASCDDIEHGVVLCDCNWKPAHRSTMKILPSKRLGASLKFNEVGEYYLFDPCCERRLRLKVNVMSCPHRKDKDITQDCITFADEALKTKHTLPRVYLNHKLDSVSQITGGVYYKGSIKELNNRYVFCDLSKRDVSEGSLFFMDNKKAQRLVVNQPGWEKNLYVCLGYNKGKLYLGTYGSLNVKDSKLGGIYEIEDYHLENQSETWSDYKNSETCSDCHSDRSCTCSDKTSSEISSDNKCFTCSDISSQSEINHSDVSY